MNQFENMADNTYILCDEERITNLIKKVFEDKFKKQKVKEDLEETDEYQTDPEYMNDSLTEIRNKLTELEDSSRRHNIRVDGKAEESGETWEEYERKFQRLLSE